MHADEYAALVAAQMSEDALQAQVELVADALGWRHYHTHDSRRSDRGFPDLVLVRAPRLVFAELKRQNGRVRPDQKLWLGALQTVAAAVEAACGQALVEVHLWRPIDITGNTIAEVLR